MNLYSYTMNNPNYYIDPHGLSGLEGTLGSIGTEIGTGASVGAGGTVLISIGIILCCPSETAGPEDDMLPPVSEPSQMTAKGNVADSEIIKDFGEYASNKRCEGKKPKDRCDWLNENKHLYRKDQYIATAKAWGCKRSRHSGNSKK